MQIPQWPCRRMDYLPLRRFDQGYIQRGSHNVACKAFQNGVALLPLLAFRKIDDL